MQPKYDLKSCQQMRETIVLKQHNGMKKYIDTRGVSVLFFTSDVSSVCQMSLIILTTQWMRVMRILLIWILTLAQQVDVCFSERLCSRCALEQRQNMIKAVRDVRLPKLLCDTPALELAFNEGLYARRSAANVLLFKHKIVVHLNSLPYPSPAWKTSRSCSNSP